MIELGIAVLIFTLIAGVATLAVARAQLSAAQDRFERSAEAELNALLVTVSTGAYDNLVAGNFLRPEPCIEAAHLSCPNVHGRTLTVTWEISGVADPTGVSTEDLAGVLVGVSATLPFGKTLERERFVASVNAGRENTTLVRVSLTGSTYSGPIYLIDSAGEVVGSALTDEMSALIRSETATCTSTAPCQLALRPDGSAREGNLTLDHLAVAGEGIVLDDDIIFETGATVREIREVHVLLLGENIDGRRAWADTTGSVCLYLAIPTPDGVVEEPACNTESAERIVWRTYHPDRENRPDLTIALPVDTNMQVLTDPTEGACNAVGQIGWSAGAWTTSAVCTGWTWGSFSELRDGIAGTGAVNTTGTLLEPGTAERAFYSAVWTATNGSPASGHADGALWEKPRDVPDCASTTSCVPVNINPENACPNGYCNSSKPSAPILLEPRRGSYKVPAVSVTPGESNTITVIAGDTEGDAITVSVSAVVSGLNHAGSSVEAGDVIIEESGGPVVIEFEIEPASGFTSDTLTLLLSDGTSVREVDILLTASSPAAHSIIAAPITLRQNDTGTVRVLVIDDTGELASGTPFTYSAPSGVTMGTPAEIEPGIYTAAIAAGLAAAGSSTYTLTSGSAEDTASLTITGEISLISVSANAVQQGANGAINANVTDSGGSPLSGAHVWFAITAGNTGTVPLGTYSKARGCVTDANGTCSVVLTVEQNATTGTFSVTATNGTVTGSGNITVTASMAKIISDGIEMEQGSASTLTFTAYNGRNEPAAGIAFTTSFLATGASVTASGTTGADGTATLNVSAGTNTPVGELVITVDDGVNQHEIRVAVLSTITTVEVPTATSVAQYGNGLVTVTARNGQGAAVPFAVLDLTPDTGIFSPDSVVTKADGTATIAFTVGTEAPSGSKNIAITYEGASVGNVALTVVTGIANLTTTSTLQTGAVRTVRLTIADNDGEPIGGRDLTFVSVDTRISVTSATVRSNLLGYADFTVTTGNVPAGLYDFTVNVDGRSIPLTLQVNL